jgi:hypothetical protein
MDQLKRMMLGGNRRLRTFFHEHGIGEATKPIDKYTSRASDIYRAQLAAEAAKFDVTFVHVSPYLA